MPKTLSLLEVYNILLNFQGPQHWWPGETQDEIIIGAILTQNVSWKNVVKAINNLHSAGIYTLKELDALSVEAIAPLIRSTLYYNQKAIKLKTFTNFLRERYQFDLQQMFAEDLKTLRSEMLKLKGLGPETVDSILLYAGSKPVFVVDAYTIRLLFRLGFTDKKMNYSQWQEFITERIPQDIELYNDFHAQIVNLCKDICRNKPRCEICPLTLYCTYYQQNKDNSVTSS
jgi:endonuclease-3 related protein